MARCVQLLSGGLDSMACAAVLTASGHAVEGLFVDYGQPARTHERLASRRVARALGIPLRTCRVPGLAPPNPSDMPGRNGLLINIAVHLSAPLTGLVGIGIHAATGYPDCSPAFVAAQQALLDVYTGGLIGVAAPFIEATKEDIWHYCREAELPVTLTYSCELGVDPPCGRCPSCHDRRRLDAGPH